MIVPKLGFNIEFSPFLSYSTINDQNYFYRHEEVSLIQYPSVSVCTEYTFKKYIDEEILSNLSMSETKNLVKSVLWKRNETFYFVNQKFENRSEFPCMTISESKDPGRPCSFPFRTKL